MIWWWILVFVALGLVVYWALAITEGAYLGRRVVALLYDWTPGYYDKIKAITWREDDEWLVTPLLGRLQEVKHPLVLDVGAGTGRFPAALLDDVRFQGSVWGLDISLGMLRRARTRLAQYGDRCRLIWQDADTLPFPARVFDAVVCLETLEFTPDPKHTLRELVRVLRPGGSLLISNRIARARWFPGRVFDDDALLDLLGTLDVSNAQIHNWNSFYDLVWAYKTGRICPEGRGDDAPQAWLCDPEAYCTQEGIVRPRNRSGRARLP
jgi:ubiquinone/menaquinone biosynthesis C-methylase UbiE